MKKEWYYNVPKEVLQRGSTPGSQSYQQNANYRAYTTVGQDDPGMAAAIIKSQIPAAQLDRLIAARQQQKSVDQTNHLTEQGITPIPTMSEQSSAALAQRNQAQQDRIAAQNQEGWLSKLGHTAAGIPGDILHGALWAGGKLFQGANAVESLLETPLAAQKASGTPTFSGATDWLSHLSDKPAPGYGNTVAHNAAGVLQGVGGPIVGTAGNVIDYIKGWGRLVSGDISDQQKADMRTAGLDPSNKGSIYNWYYNDWFGKGFRAVADQNVKRAIDDGATPVDAEAAREYVVSGAANDPAGMNMKGLSPAAQDFAQRLTAKGPDSPEGKTFETIADKNSLHFGGSFADAVGMREPGTGRDVVTALADLVGLWYVDPLGHVGDVYKASKAALYGVQADKLGEVARVIGASDPVTKAPTSGTGRVFNDLLERVDNIYLNTAAGEAAQQAGNIDKATQHFSDASSLTEQFRRLHPDMMGQFDALMQLRSGAVQDFLPMGVGPLGTEAVKAESKAALQYGRTPSWIEPVIDGTRKPAWALRTSLDETLSDADKLARLEPIRVKTAESLELAIIQEAMATGRPMFRGKIMLPGGTTMLRQARQVASPIMDAITRQDSKLGDVLKAVAANPKGSVPVHAFAGGPEEFDAATGSWTTTLQPRDHGLAAAFQRMQNWMELSPAGRNLSYYGSEGTETIRRLALQSGMPRAQAFALTNKWSMGTAGERFALWRELSASMVDAGGLRDTQAKRAAVEFMTKGVVSPLDNSSKSLSEAAAETHEKYASAERNTIQVEGRTQAAGLLPNHMSDGVTIPSMRDIKRLTGQVGLLAKIPGLGGFLTNPKLLQALRDGTTVWKSNVTSTPSNFERQLDEAIGFAGILDPGVLGRTVVARHAQTLDTAEQRLTQNRAITGARKISDAATIDDVKQLEKLQRTDPNAYRAHLANLGVKAGLTPESARALSLVSENAQISELAGMSKSGMFLAGPLDLMRRFRVSANEMLGSRDVGKNFAPWHQHIAGEAVDRILSSYLDELSTAASANRALMAGTPITGANTTIASGLSSVGAGLRKFWSKNRDSSDEIAQAARKGIVLKRPSMRPNAWTEIPTNTETGLHKWADDVDFWRNDDIGREAMRRLAFEHTQAPTLTAKAAAKKKPFNAGSAYSQIRAKEELVNDPELLRLKAQQGNIQAASPTGMPDPAIAKAINDRTAALLKAGHFKGSNITENIDELLARNDKMKMFSSRLNHNAESNPIAAGNEADLTAARWKTAEDIVAEARHMLGIKTSPIDGADLVDSSIPPVLDKIWKGHVVTANDLRNIPEGTRPPLARSPEYIPALAGDNRGKISQALSRGAAIQYDFIVGRPMQKMWNAPHFQAQLWRAYQMLTPVADHLIEKGLTPESAAHFLEHTAAQYATQAVWKTTDNPAEHTVFTELADKHLMFIRATEDFFRRLGEVVHVNPGRVARSFLAVEAGITSGAMYQQPGFSEGDPPEWMFTYPGSAFAAKTATEALRALGWGDDGVKVPVFSGWNAPVKFLNPTLGNPIGHSVNPMFALPLRIIRDSVLPSAWSPSVNPEITALEGGEDGFATKSALRSIVPTWASRVYDSLDWSESNGKLMSAFYSGLQASYAAGILPDENASPQQREDATHSLRQMMINNLVMRSLGALFLPASPWNADMKTSVTPDTNAEAMRNGVQNLRNEWFQVLEQSSRQYGSDQGLGKAHEEWARRYPLGRGIVNPEAYTVGTYKLANPDPSFTGAQSIPRTKEMVDFFVANHQLMDKYAPIFPYLLPKLGNEYFNTGANQQLFQMGLLERKGMDQFAKDVRSAQNVSDFFNRENAYKNALNNATDDQDRTRINNDWYAFQAHWEQAYPASARKMNENSDPKYVHDTLASSVGAFLKDQNLPPELSSVKPAVQELYNDYTAYRTAFLGTPTYSRAQVNKDYWNQGDAKWSHTDLADLWKAFRVYEGRG